MCLREVSRPMPVPCRLTGSCVGNIPSCRGCATGNFRNSQDSPSVCNSQQPHTTRVHKSTCYRKNPAETPQAIKTHPKCCQVTSSVPRAQKRKTPAAKRTTTQAVETRITQRAKMTSPRVEPTMVVIQWEILTAPAPPIAAGTQPRKQQPRKQQPWKHQP